MPSEENLPDLWLLETKHLLLELDRVREAILRIPKNNKTRKPVKSAVDYMWDLRQRIFELATLKTQIQRSWSDRQKKSAPTKQPAARAAKTGAGL
jgi:hypothetical protein